MSDKAKIIYSGFWDMPLAFVVRHNERQFLFWRGPFDEALDEYPDTYQVFALPDIPDELVVSSWVHIENLATERLGEIPISEIKFDRSMRQEIETQVLDALIAAR